MYGRVASRLASTIPPPEREVGGVLYFAYGSNLELAGMRRRCPGAYPLVRADLVDWTLVFETGSGAEAYANIRPQAGSVVPGALFEINARCLDKLDRYEEYPTVYDRSTIGVATLRGEREALVYIMVSVPQTRFTRPLQQHLDAVAAGYADWGIDPAPFERALALTL